jgi:hypothetical protein
VHGWQLLVSEQSFDTLDLQETQLLLFVESQAEMSATAAAVRRESGGKERDLHGSDECLHHAEWVQRGLLSSLMSMPHVRYSSMRSFELFDDASILVHSVKH